MSERFVCCDDCAVPLVMDFSQFQKEWRCPKCGDFTEFFDRHKNLYEHELTEEAKTYLPEKAREPQEESKQ